MEENKLLEINWGLCVASEALFVVKLCWFDVSEEFAEVCNTEADGVSSFAFTLYKYCNILPEGPEKLFISICKILDSV